MVGKQDTNKMVGNQDKSLLPTPSTIVKPNPPVFSFRDKVFQYAVSIIGDGLNSTQNILLANSIHTVLDILNMLFKYIESIECM